ncbi:uncharacterized protein LOC129300834 [Prosopis cineraria]|uniref:uncharacterized protein LOC129300834 n=1 Tax=Prosopis cineraria TaxID=364024 RepID=UPI00240FF233|nr:uncharacterized protein LOC129300834 [Prosopis cineraria]
MNHCVIQKQNVVVATREEMSSRDHVVCPKPRRLSLLNVAVNDHPVRSFWWHVSCQSEICDTKPMSDPLDFILAEGDYGIEQPCTQMASSPPFFCGSPPSRVENPLIQDARFGDEKFSPLSPPIWASSPPVRAPSPASSTRKGGCVRANFGNNPVVRIEGFDCLDRDRRNCSIPALA